MLKILIPAEELWDSEKEEFVSYEKEQVLTLEHSLVSISKWESRWEKPYISDTPKTYEEALDYIKCMTLTQNVDPKIYDRLDEKSMKRINAYIQAPMTATKIYEEPTKNNHKEQLTSELIYYMMIANNIPFECQKWHINRLLTLIRVCSKKNTPPKKMSNQEIMRRNSALNASRRKSLHSRG